jgi:hypothetical protein
MKGLLVYFFNPLNNMESELGHVGSLNAYKIERMAAGKDVSSCPLWEFKGKLLGWEWK